MGNAQWAKHFAYARRLWVLRLSNGGFSDVQGPSALSLHMGDRLDDVNLKR